MTLTAVLPQSGRTMNSPARPSVIALNKLVGLIVACRHPHRRHYQVRTPEGTHVTVHDPALTPRAHALLLGQQVTLHIPPNAVMISPARPIDTTEDNVWPARVVLPAGQARDNLLIVKILGQPWTLTTTQQEGPLARPLRAWDRVTVQIRPEACVIEHRYPDNSRLRPRLLTKSSCPTLQSHHT